MSLHSRPNSALGKSNHHEYAVQFRRHCHQLIVVGYNRIRSEHHGKSREDFITQRLKEEVKEAQRERTLPRWAYRYFITDQAPVSGPSRDAEARPKIDIEIESGEVRDRPVFHFEAKRLRVDDTHSVSEYVGPAGLGSFLTELYARSGDEGAMLGYVQSESPDHWVGKIQRKLQNDTEGTHRITNDGDWATVRLLPELEHTYSTRHNRPTLSDITIFHTLLDFRCEEDES